MEKELYFQTYPLGTISLSLLSAIICLLIGILGTFIISWEYTVIYLILYFIVLIYNIKFRSVICGYYGRVINSNFGKFAQKLPPKIDLQKIDNKNNIVIIISLISYLIIIFPAVGGVIRLVQGIILDDLAAIIVPIILLTVYIIFLLYPVYILKKKVFPAYCQQ